MYQEHVETPGEVESPAAALRRRWIEALRSGKFKQCRDRLKRGDAYCAYGVLAATTGRDDCWMEDGLGFDWGNAGMDATLLSDTVAGTDIVTMNDTMKMSFEQIADRLEAAK